MPGSLRSETAPQHATDSWTHRQWLCALGAVLVFWCIAALVWPLTSSVVPWDSKNHFYPMLRYLGAALAGGELPLWNPYHFSGHPAVADPQSLLFTPTMLLFGWLVPQPSMQLFDAVVFAHFLPGALAILGLFSRRGWRPEGGVIAAVIFVLGGSASARLQHTGIIFGYGYFPLALLLLEQALDRSSYRFGCLFAVVASLMVLGRDQVAFLSGLVLVGLVLHKTFESGAPVAYLRDRVGVLALAGAVGAALLAVPVILTMQFLMTSTRPAFGYGVAAMGSLPPESFATILFANVFGSLNWTYDYWGPDWHSLVEGTWTDRATNYLFVGTVPALLILWQGIGAGRLFAREFRFFLIVGLVATVYALGRYTPLFSVIFDNLPGIALYRRPADATFLMNVVLAFAAGYLVHRYLTDGIPRLSAMRRSPSTAVLMAATIAMVAAAILSGLVFAIRAHQTPTAATEIALALVLATAAVYVLARASSSPPARLVVASLLVAFTAGELIWRNAASALNAEPAERYAVFRELPPEQLQGLHVLKEELARRHAKGEFPRLEILGLGGAWQNASMVLGLEDTIGYNPLRLADYERAIGPGENAADPNLRTFPGTFRGYRCRLASLLGLEYLVLDRPVERLPRHFPRLPGASLLYGSGSMWVYHLSPTAPRAYLATQLVPIDSESVLAEAELPDFDRTKAALIEQSHLSALSGDYGVRDTDAPTTPASGSVTIKSYRRNSVLLDVNTDRKSIVVLHDIYYPGWEATVDGKVEPILRTNVLFRGVEVPAGHHVVEFEFRPMSLGNLMAAATDLLDKDAGEAATVTR
ncbi:MAG TPA: YfhO family protein [Enterovirga sp.]